MTTPTPPTRASSSWTGEPGEFRPPRYASPQAWLSPGIPYPTVGRQVGRWIERNLVHGEGDALGRPVRLLLFQWYVLNRLYEYDPETGRLLHDRVLVMMPKGNSKTELFSHVGLAELMGPFAPLSSPRVTTSAASFKQVRELFNAATLAITEGPLKTHFQRGLHLLDDKILLPGGTGVLERIAAIGGTADGGKESCHIGDEVHEWKGERRERVYVVKGKSLRKRRVVRPRPAPDLPYLQGSLQIGISTPGDDATVATDDPLTILAKLYRHGVRVATGEVVDPGFLFLCWEASKHWNLDDSEQLRQAILEANPAAGDFLDTQGKVTSYHDPTVPRHEFLRYDLGHWVQAEDAWFSLELWADLGKAHKVPPPGTKVWLGFAGSVTRDEAALWGATADGYVFEVETWTNERHLADWTVPRAAVDGAIEGAMEGGWKIGWLAAKPTRWEHEVEAWSKRWPKLIVSYPTNTAQRFAPAVGRFHDGVVTGAITHDGSSALARAIANAKTRETAWGLVIEKEHKDSPRQIVPAEAAVLAFEGTSAPASKAVDRTVHSWS